MSDNIGAGQGQAHRVGGKRRRGESDSGGMYSSTGIPVQCLCILP